MIRLPDSKKARAAIVAVLTVLAGWGCEALGIQVPDHVIERIVAALAAYMVGQGIADVGKEKAKVQWAASVAPRPVAPPPPSTADVP